MRPVRPLDATVLVLEIIQGLFYVVVGAYFTFLNIAFRTPESFSGPPQLGDWGLVAVALLPGTIYLFAGVGALRRAGWSWRLGIIGSIIFIIIGSILTGLILIPLIFYQSTNILSVIVLTVSLPTIAIASAVLATLLRPRVKEYFGKTSPGRS